MRSMTRSWGNGEPAHAAPVPSRPVDPGHPGAHPAYDLVGDGVGPPGPFPCGDVLAPLAAEEDGGFVRFTVADTGEGIAAEHLPRIFEKFYRVPGSRDKGGAGLGLAIAREIITAHAGQIDVASRLGEGTTFTFTLPIEPRGDGHQRIDILAERNELGHDFGQDRKPGLLGKVLEIGGIGACRAVVVI